MKLLIITLLFSTIASGENIHLEQHATDSVFVPLLTFQYFSLLRQMDPHFTNSTEIPLMVFSQEPGYGSLSDLVEHHTTNSTVIPLRTINHRPLSSSLERLCANSTNLPIKIILYGPLSAEVKRHITNSSHVYIVTGNKADFSRNHYTFDVKRDFSSVQVQIKNNAEKEIVNITAIVLDPEEPMSFIGYGEPILPISLQPGETKNLTIGLTLSQAKKLAYTYKLLLYHNSFIMDESWITLNLPSWDKYNFSVTGPYIHSPWNISMDNVSNASLICLTSKQTITIKNTGLEPISDITIITSGDLEFFLQPSFSVFKIEPNETIEFIAYVLVDNETPPSNGTITIFGVNTNVTIFVTYTPPPVGGNWSTPPEFPTESYLTATVISFLCVNQPHFCVNINLPTDLSFDTIRESFIIMNFEDRCISAQPHDTKVYLNNNLVKTWLDTTTIGQYEFSVPKEYINVSNHICVDTYNYKGGGHFCASVGNSIKLKVTSYQAYCIDRVNNITCEKNETNFTDGKDNDCDGFTDCYDLDSCSSTVCNNSILCPKPENCTNGIDDDGNGLTDWDDITVCIGNCSDGYKNGQEKGVDCGGPNCSACVPDLTLHQSDISFPNPSIQGQNVNISITVDNIGYVYAENVKVQTYSNTSLDKINETTISKINAQENFTFTFNYSWSELGFHEIRVDIDPDDEILELNETNNNASRLMNILPPYCYTETTISGVVKRNNVVIRNLNVSVFFNGNSLGKNITNINGVYSINLNLSAMPSAGSINITVIATIDSEEYTYYTKISCGEDRDFDIVMEDWNEPPVIYTLDETGQYERVFKPDSYVDIIVVVKNPSNSPVAGKIDVYITDESGKKVGDYIKYRESLFIKSNSYKTYNLTWNTEDYGKVNLSGFEFIGKKFYVTVKLKDTYKYGFYVDEYGVPKWLRNNTEYNPASLFEKAVLDARSKSDKVGYLKEQYNIITKEAEQKGFTSILFHNYYSFGYHESNQFSKINYWFPAGPDGDEHYSTPNYNLLQLTNGNEEQVRNLIKNLVGIAHDSNLKVVAYIDPMAIYDPEPEIQLIDFIQGYLWHGYPVANKHQNSTSLGWVAMDENQKPKRVNFLESTAAYWIGLGLRSQYLQYLSDANRFAYQISPCGPGKLGKANDENAFSASTIKSDLNSNPENDPSHHYHIVKQTSWLMQYYGFDGIMPDDEGRLIMDSGPADYVDDTWTALMHPEKPTDSLYGTSEDQYCKDLRGNSDKDNFAMDSLANMVNHMRDQIKDYGEEKYLISNDYFVPADVGWESIIASEDVSASDQFNIMAPSFARWAYKTYYDGYKTLRNDLRRSLQTIPVLDKAVEVPIPGEPISYESMKYRPHLLRGVLLATSWANKVHTEVINDELKKSPETEQLLSSYIKMRNTIDLPVYSSEVGQELIYHSNLKEPEGFQKSSEIEHVGDKPYTVLYKIHSDYGEKARILHVINTRVISNIKNNDDIPKEYSFRVKIPAGEEVSAVYLVSADVYNGSIDPDRDGNPNTDYTADITSKTILWHIEGTYIFLKIPQVITSTVVYIEFNPADNMKKSFVTSSRINANGFVEKVQNYVLSSISQNQTLNQTLQVTSSDISLDLSLDWSGSDLDLHLFSPSGQHIGFNYTTNSTEAIGNSTYDTQGTSEGITIQNPEPGNWTLGVFGKDVSGEGEPYTLAINIQGNYSPNMNAEIIPKTAVVNETVSLPLTISNIGEATAYNISVSFVSDYFNISENLSYEELEAGVNINTEIFALPMKLGNGTIQTSVEYYDNEGKKYSFNKSATLQIVTNPSVSIFYTYSPELNTNTKDTLVFTMTIMNVGSSTAYDINISLDLQNITPMNHYNFSISQLSPGESVNLTFNATSPSGQWYTTVYAEYESVNGSAFLAGSNELEIDIEEATTYMDLDGDYVDEYANDTNNDTIYDKYVDPNNNSIAIETRDFNLDSKPDFLIDTNNDGEANIFYGPNNGFYTGIVSINLSDNLTDKLLLAVDKDTTLDFYYDVSNNITTKLKQFNMTSYYIDADGDGLYDVLYDLLTGKSCNKGDLNCDAVVNRTDHLHFEQVYEATCSNINYNHLADFNDDCNITFVDFVRFARRYTE